MAFMTPNSLVFRPITTPKWALVSLVVVFGIAGGAVSVLLADNLFLLAALLVGLPLIALTMMNATRKMTLILLLAFVPITGLLKSITGVRFAALPFDLGIFAVCFWHFVSRLFNRRLPVEMLDALLGLFLLLALAEVFNSNVPGLQAGAEGFRKFAYMAIAFYAGRHILEDEDLRRFRNWLLILAVPISLYAIKQFFWVSALDQRIIDMAIETGRSSINPYMIKGQIRPFSTLSGPFHLGLYLMVTILLTLRQLQEDGLTRKLKWALTGFAALQMVALLLTQTKGNWVGLMAGTAALLVLQAKRGSLRIMRLSAAAAVGAVCVAAALSVVAAFSTTASHVLEDALTNVTHPTEAPTLQFRLSLWGDRILPAIANRPILGYGTSSAGEGLGGLYEHSLSYYFLSHNLYLKIVLELGIFGLALFLAILVLSLWRPRGEAPRGVAAANRDAALAVVAAFLTAGLVIPVLDAYPANYYFWLLLGALSVRRATREA